MFETNLSYETVPGCILNITSYLPEHLHAPKLLSPKQINKKETKVRVTAERKQIAEKKTIMTMRVGTDHSTGTGC